MANDEYQVGGSLATDAPSYVERQADIELYNSLKLGKFCYILNSRRMGKSSLLVRIRHVLEQEGFSCTSIDMTRIGSKNITPQQWYKGIAYELWQGFNLYDKVNLKSWWREVEDLSALKKLSHFIERVLLVKIPSEKIFIFIDEIDSMLSLNFSVDDFFDLIFFCYTQRAINPEYNRLTFALFGMSISSDLIRDRNGALFNIGKAIDLHPFQEYEVQPLLKGLTGKINDPQAVLKEILAWTGGQPFLTQKLCELVRKSNRDAISDVLTIPRSSEVFWLEQLVQKHIIEGWETRDELEHLRMIRDRLLSNRQRAGCWLELYQQILQQGGLIADEGPEQMELLLSGLVVKQQGQVRVYNRIYAEVFNQAWIRKQLNKLHPSSQALDA